MKRKRVSRITDSHGTSIKEEKEKLSKSQSILELPCSILFDILCRLSLNTIFHCRLVCKTWLQLLLHPDFAKFHLTRSPVSLVLQSPTPRHKGKQPKDLFLVNLEATDIRRRGARTKLGSNLTLLKWWNYKIADSCNGLLCLCHRISGTPVYILNPVTGVFITIPQAHPSSCSWFGFCPKTNQYKVLRVFPERGLLCSMLWEAEVYTLGTGSWRRIGGTPNSPCKSPCDTFLNGSVHWVVDDPNSSEFIYSFDFRNETFRPIPPPSHFGPDHKKKARGMSLGVFRACLCISNYSSSNRYVIWMMEKYGVQQSWSKQFIIDIPLKHSPPTNAEWLWDVYLPIKLLNDDEILMLRNRNALVTYNLGRKRFKTFKIPGTGSDFEAIVSHIPSFVSLNM